MDPFTMVIAIVAITVGAVADIVDNVRRGFGAAERVGEIRLNGRCMRPADAVELLRHSRGTA